MKIKVKHHHCTWDCFTLHLFHFEREAGEMTLFLCCSPGGPVAETVLPPPRGSSQSVLRTRACLFRDPVALRKGASVHVFSPATHTLTASRSSRLPLGGWDLCKGSWLLTCIFLMSAPASGLRLAYHPFTSVSPGLSAPWSRERATSVRLRAWHGFCQLEGLLQRSKEAVAGGSCEQVARACSVTLLPSCNTSILARFSALRPESPRHGPQVCTGPVRRLAAPR